MSDGVDVCNYLDDFGGAETPSLADAAFADLQNTLGSLGLEEAPEKAVRPTTCMTFLGIDFDTVSMTRRVPQFRLEEIRLLVSAWLNKKKATRRELQSLIGKLVFVSSCVPPGRLFISRMLEALRSLRRNHHRLRLTRDFRLDLKWWQRFMDSYNGVSMMVPDIYSDPDELVMTDACATGCGGFSNGQFVHCEFPERTLEQFGSKIHVLEMLTIVVAARKWAPQWFGQRILVHCDNMACVHVLNSGRARDRELLQCARELWLLAATFEFQVKATHIQGSHNRIADHLSRWHLSTYHSQQFKSLTRHQTTCVPIDLIRLQGDWRSDAYLLYLKVPLATRLSLCSRMVTSIQTTRTGRLTGVLARNGAYGNIVYLYSYTGYILATEEDNLPVLASTHLRCRLIPVPAHTPGRARSPSGTVPRPADCPLPGSGRSHVRKVKH
ncbi:hypothetical protein Bbelb_406620 [Branchiostoma belcheri]|nr:hypothetical protein Bbelb_406620 [Branchiostoma belcheri]